MISRRPVVTTNDDPPIRRVARVRPMERGTIKSRLKSMRRNSKVVPQRMTTTTTPMRRTSIRSAQDLVGWEEPIDLNCTCDVYSQHRRNRHRSSGRRHHRPTVITWLSRAYHHLKPPV